MEGYHKSVLLRETLGGLRVTKGSWYLDLTLGDGGHTLGILKEGGNVVGVDVDPQALDRAGKRIKDQGIDRSRDRLVKGNFSEIKNLIQHKTDLRDNKFAGAIFDLGVSSLQLENPERGFSFLKDAPLDMRMDPDLSVKALDLVNGLNKGELYELFNNLGEEIYSRSLAEALVSARALKRIQTTRELAEIAEKVIGRQGKIHPATKIFQAIRIAVNDELNALKEGLDQVKDLVKENGFILVISFHSLEDRIVKRNFRNWQELGFGKVLTKKPAIGGSDEISKNPRSRSAKLRIFEKLKNDNHSQIRTN